MPYLATIAEVAELADALDSKSSVVTLRAGSSPAFGTIENAGLAEVSARSFFMKFCLEKCRGTQVFHSAGKINLYMCIKNLLLVL